MPTRCPHPTAEEVGSEPVAATAPTLDRDLPGPRWPAVLQSIQWLARPPLRWTIRLGAKYGETFRLRVLAPSHADDRTRRPVTPRTVVMLSHPSHLQEVFARSREDLLSGEASEFITWHSGGDSVVVLDGAAHRAERQALQATVRGTLLPLYERLTRAAMQTAIATWPASGTIPLAPLVHRAAMEAAITCLFGPLEPSRLRRLRELVEAGAVTTSLPPPLMMLPMLQRDLGPWSPGGRILRAKEEFDRLVATAMEERAGRAASLPEENLLDALQPGGPGDSLPTAVVIQRARTMMSALKTAAVAAVWLCYHILGDEEIQARILDSTQGDSEPGGYLEAVCKESLRLNPPFMGGFRRVAAPTTFGGIAWQTGTLVMPNASLTHRRPDLFPEPERFRPERFLERAYGPHEFAPFGGGIRRCLGEQLALRQMGIVAVELLRAFEIEPAGRWGRAEQRRHTMILPRDPLRARIRRRGAPAPRIET